MGGTAAAGAAAAGDDGEDASAAYPDVIVGDGGFGTVKARIPKPDGEIVITRYTLREVLDKLEELVTGHDGGN